MSNSKSAGGQQWRPAAGVVLLAVSHLVAGTGTQAQTTDLEAERVFEGSVSVTATRTARPTEEVAGSVTVIGEETIEQTAMSNLREALVGIPGTLIVSKNQGYDARLIIRGAGLKARYAIREIMVLLDGVPITDPDSLTRLDFVDTHMIDRIEVVRGPNSTLWGFNATGGVVNVITRSPFAGQGGRARVDLETDGARRYHVSFSGPFGARHAFSVDLSRREASTDWRPWNHFETTQLTLQPSFVLGDNTLWENTISFTDAQIQLPGRLIVNPAFGVDQWGPYLDAGEVAVTAEPWKHSSRDSRILFVSSRLTTRIGRFVLKPQLFLNRWQHLHPVTGRINRSTTADGGLDLQADHHHSAGVLTAGLSLRSDRQDGAAWTYRDVLASPDGRILSTVSDEPGDLMRTLERRTNLIGAYIQESLRPGRGWVVDLGLRIDRLRFEYSGFEQLAYDYGEGRYVAGEGDIDRAVAYTALSPRLGVVRQLSQQLHLYAAIAGGVQTPTADELGLNPELELTRVESYELGLKGRLRHLSFDGAIFFSPVRGEVVQIVQGHGETGYTNAGRTEKSGLELSVVVRPGPGLVLSGSYTYSDFVFADFSEPVRGRDADRSGNHLPFVPEHQYSLAAQWTGASGLHFRLSATTWGEYFVDNANSGIYQGFQLATDFTAGYETGRYEIAVLVQNLFDQRYAVEVQKDLYGVHRYSPAAPRAVIGRLRCSF